MKRRRTPREMAKPYECALTSLAVLEKAVMAQIVGTPDFTLDDVIDWLWAPKYVCALKAPYAFCDMAWKKNYAEYNVPLRPDLCVTLAIDLEKVKMLPPVEGLIQVCAFRQGDTPLATLLYAMQEQAGKFHAVRNVIEYLNEHTTPGAAAYYFPSIKALLPEDHILHKLDGTRSFQEPNGVAAMVPVFRDASATLAAALLCPKEYEACTAFAVGFGAYDTPFGIL